MCYACSKVPEYKSHTYTYDATVQTLINEFMISWVIDANMIFDEIAPVTSGPFY